MSTYSLLYQSMLRLKDAVDQTGIFALVRRLQREQYLQRSELQEIRRTRLVELLIHARAQSPYYRDVLSSNGTPLGSDFRIEDLPKLPLLARDDLQEHGSRILCPKATGHYPDASGGSTGQPVRFYHDQGYRSWAKANEILHAAWMGVGPGDRTAVFWGADRDLPDHSWRTRMRARLDRILTLNSFSMTEERIAAFLRTLNRVRPSYVYGYASSLYHVASFINSHEPLSFAPLAVKSSAEMLFDFQRREIEAAFKAPVFNFYGSREVNNVAAECPEHEGLHVFESGRIVEVVDDRGQPVPCGEIGNIAITDLTNMAFPFLRYLNGDLASEFPEQCPCGRTYRRLGEIVGRSSDIIQVDGSQIHGEYFTHLFYGSKTVKEFQLVQETERSFTLVVVPRHDHVDLAYFREELEKKLGRGVRLDIRVSDRVPSTPGGKHRFTISRLEPPHVRWKRESELDRAGRE